MERCSADESEISVSLSRKNSLRSPSAALLAAILVCFLSCFGPPPAGAEEPAQGQQGDQSRYSCRLTGDGTAINRCPRCCAKNVSGNECVKCGHPLQTPRNALSYPRLPDSEYDARLKDLTRTERSIGRSMRSLDENLRYMKSTVNRIRTIDRQIGAMRRR